MQIKKFTNAFVRLSQNQMPLGLVNPTTDQKIVMKQWAWFSVLFLR